MIITEKALIQFLQMFDHIWTLNLTTGVQLNVIISFLHCNLQLRSDVKRPVAAKENCKYSKKEIVC